MPVETRPIRGMSAVGRFPSATLEFGEDTEEGKEEPREENNAETENACGRCLQQVCSCGPKPNDDITDTLATAADDPEKEDSNEPVLKVLSIDLMRSQTGENRTQHHTHLYQSDDFMFRRGQNFQMGITLSRPFNPNTDRLHLEFITGRFQTVSEGTRVIVPLVEDLEYGCWGAALVEQDDKGIKLSVSSPPTAVVTRYRLRVECGSANSQEISTCDHPNNIYLLFNPWCEDDTVFLDSEEKRQEYVLNDNGLIYYGTEKQIGVRSWNYGQFDDGILAICFFLLEKSGAPAYGWGNPINVVRVISAMINCQDDDGVVAGNWSGDYSGGTSPTYWTGSVEILKEYHKNRGTPVKFGQCWVFAGICTTVLRCFGIPTRTVTNFSSAHDTDVSLTTDIFFDENLYPIRSSNTDSIWNFHVWNDCWMARPDLPLGYGGWQAVDATPQETSQGTFRCGPASLAAVRSGYVYLKYDSPFVFAEVNSDIIYWQRNADGTFTQIQTIKNSIGHFISTKAVGSDERNDITHLYKHAEGTEEERIAVETACSYGSRAEAFPSSIAEDVSIVEVTMDGEGPKMGEDVKLTIILRNCSSEQRKVALYSQVAVMYYTGVLKATVRKDKMDVDMLPNKETFLEWNLGYKEYKDRLIDQAALMLTLTGRVRETRQVLATRFNFRLRTPDLILKPVGTAVVGQRMAVEISFTNPLPQTLKAVIFNIEGLGLVAARKINYGDIGSHASVTLLDHFVPSLHGPRKLLASLDCKELTQVHGVTNITVEAKSSAAL